MIISFKQKGDFSNLTKYLNNSRSTPSDAILNKYGEKGVAALAAATPVDTGKTASSWKYRIVHGRNGMRLEFTNSNIQNGVPIAILIQYGHATKNGGWVEGRDYINPVIEKIFEELMNELRKGVT